MSAAILDSQSMLHPLLHTGAVELPCGARGWNGAAAAMVALAGAGWVEPVERRLELTELGRANRGLIQALSDLTRQVAHLPLDLDHPGWTRALDTNHVVDLRIARHGEDDTARSYLQGVLATVILAIHASPTAPQRSTALSALTAALGWGTDDRPTPTGELARRYRPMYGLIGSYHEPLLACARGEQLPPGAIQARTDRAANVAASGAAHAGYFDDATDLVIDLCSRGDTPVHAVVDVGCGDGTWIREIALRLRARDPSAAARLVFVGVDYDSRALAAALANLDGIETHLLAGDIGAPATLARDIADRTGVDPAHTLHLRSFVDHNRRPAEVDAPVPSSWFDGALAITHGGTLLGRDELLADWADHLGAWSKVSGPAGMLVLEAHTARPAVVHTEAGRGHRLAFQLYHALSGQCPVPLGLYGEAIARAGLSITHQQLVPASVGAISISHLVPVDARADP